MKPINEVINLLYNSINQTEDVEELDIHVSSKSLTPLCDTTCEMMLDVDGYVMVATIFYAIRAIDDELADMFSKKILSRIVNEKSVSKQHKMRICLDVLSDYLQVIEAMNNE